MRRIVFQLWIRPLASGALALALVGGVIIPSPSVLPPGTGVSTKPPKAPPKKCLGPVGQCGW